MITAAQIIDRTRAMRIARHTNRQSRRIERFLNYIEIKSDEIEPCNLIVFQFLFSSDE